MARGVDNHGVGALYGTFDIHQTGGDYDLTDADIGKAVALTANNEAGWGTNGDALLGRLEHICNGIATVQIAGVVRVPHGASAPSVGNAVVVNGSGRVLQAPALTVDLNGTGVETLISAGGAAGRGMVLAVDTANETVDILIT